jgi:soluble lytic murein transglycosylase-like protein
LAALSVETNRFPFTAVEPFVKKILALAPLLLLATPATAQQSQYESLVQSHAAANGVPASLVHRVIMRESRYNPRAVGRGGALGMMQIKLATARGMGYSGGAQGLLDANTNLAYAVKYLAGAYRAAGGNQDRAVGYYASGYYYAAKRQGLTTTTVAEVTPATSPLQAFAFAAPEPAPRSTRNRALRTTVPAPEAPANRP